MRKSSLNYEPGSLRTHGATPDKDLGEEREKEACQVEVYLKKGERERSRTAKKSN